MKIISTLITILILSITTTYSGQASSSQPSSSRGSSNASEDTGLTERAPRPTRPTLTRPAPTRIKKTTKINDILRPRANCLREKSEIKVRGSYLQSGDVQCSTSPNLSLKELQASENQLTFQVKSNVLADRQYIINCSGNGANKRITAKGCPDSIKLTGVTGRKPTASNRVDLLVSQLMLTGESKNNSGDIQSFKLTVKNGEKPGNASNLTPKRQPYKTKVFLAGSNQCKQKTATMVSMSKILAQKEVSFTTIPTGGMSQTKMVHIPLPQGLDKGDYFWHALVDSTYKVRESRENNNLFCLDQAIRISGEEETIRIPGTETVPYSSDSQIPKDSPTVSMPKPPYYVTCNGHVPTIKGDNGDNIIHGTSGPDVIQGGAGNDTIYGHGGNDIICGGSGNDLIYGGSGDDTIFGNGSDATSTFNNYNLPWDAKHDRIYGGTGNDILDGGPGSDSVFGEAGNDTLIGAEHLDNLIGGSGDDLYLFTKSGPAAVTIVEDPNVNTDTIDFSNFPTPDGINVSLNYSSGAQVVKSGQLTLSLSSDTGIENLIGTPYRDILIGNSRDNLIKGGDSPVVVYSGNKPCNLNNQNAEVLVGLEGNDTLLGEGGSDVLWGDNAWDYNGSGPPGNDILTGGGDNSSDCLYGGPGDDQLTGGKGNDWLEGGPDNDTFIFKGANLGNDVVNEAPEIDTDTLDYSNFTEPGGICVDIRMMGPFHCQNSQSALAMYVPSGSTGVTGIENVIGSNYNDQISGNSRDNVIQGGAGIDFIIGRRGNDTLIGGNDNDTMRGGPGNDTLLGDAGDDKLTGDDVLSQAYPITWTDMINVQKEGANGNNLRKTGGTADYDAGAASVETLSSGNGFVSTTVNENNTNRAIALTNGNPDTYYTGMDFAIYFYQNGLVSIFENSSEKFSGLPYQPGDDFIIEVNNGQVLYKKNGNTFYTSTNSPTYPLLVDTTFVTPNSTLRWTGIGGGFVQTGIDTCNGGSGNDSGGSSCETKISIENDMNAP